ncbi:MAG: hypothetical protein J6A01_00640, partial [Proteobacteria bacterium]|nr:hypothetical protein [Pseudomonadota bacterium]
CVKCEENTQKCEDGIIKQCVNGEWQEDVANSCEYGCRVTDAKIECRKCTPGTCENGAMCDNDGMESEPCESGQCNGDQCASSVIPVDTSCSAEDADCILCNGNQEGWQDQICNSCKDGSSQKNTQYCTQYNGDSYEYTCNSESSFKYKACGTGSCDGSVCVECLGNTVKCTDGRIIECSNGKMVTEDCTYGCEKNSIKCNDNPCKDNKEYVFQCTSEDNNNLTLCLGTIAVKSNALNKKDCSAVKSAIKSNNSVDFNTIDGSNAALDGCYTILDDDYESTIEYNSSKKNYQIAKCTDTCSEGKCEKPCDNDYYRCSDSNPSVSQVCSGNKWTTLSSIRMVGYEVPDNQGIVNYRADCSSNALGGASLYQCYIEYDNVGWQSLKKLINGQPAPQNTFPIYGYFPNTKLTGCVEYFYDIEESNQISKKPIKFEIDTKSDPSTISFSFCKKCNADHTDCTW